MLLKIVAMQKTYISVNFDAEPSRGLLLLTWGHIHFISSLYICCNSSFKYNPSNCPGADPSNLLDPSRLRNPLRDIAKDTIKYPSSLSSWTPKLDNRSDEGSKARGIDTPFSEFQGYFSPAYDPLVLILHLLSPKEALVVVPSHKMGLR